MSSELTAPPRLGLKVGSIAPVVASKAKIRLRTRSSPVLPKVPAGLTEVNVPAAMILLPTWVIALTEPFMTCGVMLAGLAETTRLPWSALTAWPVVRTRPVRASSRLRSQRRDGGRLSARVPQGQVFGPELPAARTLAESVRASEGAAPVIPQIGDLGRAGLARVLEEDDDLAVGIRGGGHRRTRGVVAAV